MTENMGCPDICGHHRAKTGVSGHRGHQRIDAYVNYHTKHYGKIPTEFPLTGTSHTGGDWGMKKIAIFEEYLAVERPRKAELNTK